MTPRCGSLLRLSPSADVRSSDDVIAFEGATVLYHASIMLSYMTPFLGAALGYVPNQPYIAPRLFCSLLLTLTWLVQTPWISFHDVVTLSFMAGTSDSSFGKFKTILYLSMVYLVGVGA